MQTQNEQPFVDVEWQAEKKRDRSLVTELARLLPLWLANGISKTQLYALFTDWNGEEKPKLNPLTHLFLVEKAWGDYQKNRKDSQPINQNAEVPEHEPRAVNKHTAETEKDKKRSMIANFPGLIDLCTDEHDKVIYLVKKGDTAVIEYDYTINGSKVYPPSAEFLPFRLPYALNVKTLMLNEKNAHSTLKTPMDKGFGECGESGECNYTTGRGSLLNGIISYLYRHAYLHEGQMLIVALSICLTYLQDHEDIDYIPIILFYAVPERGKSRVGKAATLISYRGVHCVDLREANLFRYTENLRATLFLDVMNVWQKAERSGSEDVLLLRYEKGARATRVLYPEKGPFKDTVFFSVFGSTFISTNEPVHKILDTRCLNITMPNKPGRYENPSPEKAQELKEKLTAWRGMIMNKPLPVIAPIEGIQGRLWDICYPLLSICKSVAPERYNELVVELLQIAGQRYQDMKDSIEGQIVETLYLLSLNEHGNEWMLKTSDVVSKINEKRVEGYKVDSRYIGKKLKALGLKTAIRHGGHSHIEIEKESFNTLCMQHGITEKGQRAPAPENHSPDSLHSPKPVLTRGLVVESALNEGKTHAHSTDNKSGIRKNALGASCSDCMRNGDCMLTDTQATYCGVNSPSPF